MTSELDAPVRIHALKGGVTAGACPRLNIPPKRTITAERNRP
jgi:hypothetical protein